MKHLSTYRRSLIRVALSKKPYQLASQEKVLINEYLELQLIAGTKRAAEIINK